MRDQGAKEHQTAVAPMLSVRNEATAIEFIRAFGAAVDRGSRVLGCKMNRPST